MVRTFINEVMQVDKCKESTRLLLKMDYLGFFGSWALVGVIILLLWLMVSIR